MSLFNKLNQEVWIGRDFGTATGLGLSGTIYTTPEFITVSNLTGYTLKIRLYDQDGYEVFSDDCNILVAASGTWEYLPTDGELNFDFVGEVRIELLKATQRTTAVGVNGSSRLRIIV